MAGKLQRQKHEKKESLVDASYDLFLKKGFNKTSIDDIVKKANVAKGTFYLYFKDKSDVMENIVLRMSSRILVEAYRAADERGCDDLVENIIFVVDYIVEYFKRNKLLLQMLKRDFSWPLIREKIDELSPEYGEALEVLESFLNHPYFAGQDPDEVFKLLFLIIELCGSICYTSIIHNQPDDIDHMKPFLYGVIRKILKK